MNSQYDNDGLSRHRGDWRLYTFNPRTSNIVYINYTLAHPRVRVCIIQKPPRWRLGSTHHTPYGVFTPSWTQVPGSAYRQAGTTSIKIN